MYIVLLKPQLSAMIFGHAGGTTGKRWKWAPEDEISEGWLEVLELAGPQDSLHPQAGTLPPTPPPPTAPAIPAVLGSHQGFYGLELDPSALHVLIIMSEPLRLLHFPT
jgi:hypothetical protein